MYDNQEDYKTTMNNKRIFFDKITIFEESEEFKISYNMFKFVKMQDITLPNFDLQY